MSAIAKLSTQPIRISIIVPVYNNPKDLAECLGALKTYSCSGAEIIVVDDASTDETPSVAAQTGVHVLRLTKNSGVAAARNYGARHACGEILFFVDADVVIAPCAVDRVMKAFEEHPGVTAVFGSYDAQPRAKGVVSQYRNLLHYFVHQSGDPAASTFWAGCGAIRRSVFEEIGGFDEKRYRYPSIEDIELGYRLRQAGHRILLDKAIQGTHLKHWNLRSIILTDISRRAIPWSRLILERGELPDDLNLKRRQRLSGALVALCCMLILISFFQIELLGFAAAALMGVIILNRDLYVFFFRQHGLVFAGACILLHLLYYLYSVTSYVFVWTSFHIMGLATPPSGSLQKQ